MKKNQRLDKDDLLAYLKDFYKTQRTSSDTSADIRAGRCRALSWVRHAIERGQFDVVSEGAVPAAVKPCNKALVERLTVAIAGGLAAAPGFSLEYVPGSAVRLARETAELMRKGEA